jgi:hypothetical protein
VQTDATRTCGLLVGLRDVTVLGVDEKLRLPDEVCVDLQHPWIHRPIAIPEGSGAQFDAVTSKWGMPPKCRSGSPRSGTQNVADKRALAAPDRLF